MFDVITIGSAVLDTFLVSDEFQIIKSDAFAGGYGECINLGDKVDVSHLAISTGGGATNSAATFSSLGLSSAAICKIGNDTSGQAILDDLHAFDVNTSLVKQVKKGQTGQSTLLTTTDGERSILVFRGVSREFKKSDIVRSQLKTRFLYISSLGGDYDVLEYILTFAQRQKIKVAWNPGNTELTGPRTKLKAALKLIDILIVNKQEAELITKKELDHLPLLTELAAYAPTVVLTDGLRGSFVKSDDGTIHARPTGVKAVSRAGAGDAFGSGFVAGIALGHDIGIAAQIGTLNAESVIQSFGAKQGILKKIPNKKQLDTIKVRSL